MFDWLFGKRPPTLPETVWMTDAARWDGVVARVRAAPGPVLVLTFFEATSASARARFAAAGLDVVEVDDVPRPWEPGARVVLARADRLRHVVGNLPTPLTVVGAELHPLPAEGLALVEALAARTTAAAHFHAALDDALLQRFGGDRIAALMTKLGGAPDEPIEHPLVSRSLADARAKIAARVRNPREATSMAEWFARNLDG